MKFLRWSSILLFVFSIFQLAISASMIIFGDVLSLEVLSPIYVSSAQDAAISLLGGVCGAAAGYIGILMTRNKASLITLRYFGTGLLLITIASYLIIFSMGAVFPWLGAILVVILSAGYLYGIYKETGKL